MLNFANISVEELKQSNIFEHINNCIDICNPDINTKQKIQELGIRNFIDKEINEGNLYYNIINHGTLYMKTPQYAETDEEDYMIEDIIKLNSREGVPYDIVSYEDDEEDGNYCLTATYNNLKNSNTKTLLKIHSEENLINHPYDYYERKTFKITCTNKDANIIRLYNDKICISQQNQYTNVNDFNYKLDFIKPIDLEVNSQEYLNWVSFCESNEISFNNYINNNKNFNSNPIYFLPPYAATTIILTGNMFDFSQLLWRIKNLNEPQLEYILTEISKSFK